MTRIDELQHYLSHLLSRTVRWETAMHRLLSAPNTAFIEVGPAAILSGMMQYLDRTARVRTASEVLKCFKREDSVAEGDV